MTTRKPNGRSSIYRDDQGTWHGWVTVGVRNDGSPDRRHRRGGTEAEVTRKVRELERKRDAGTAGKAGRPLTVADWFDTWLNTIAPRTVSENTLATTYRPKVRRWIVPALGEHRLDRLQPEHLDAFYVWLNEQGLKPNTILQIHRILSRGLKVAWKRGKISRNVTAMIDAPVGEETDIEPLTQDEARRILQAAASRRNGARWSVALAVSIRQAEAIGLRWQFVNLDAGTIEVGWQLRRGRFQHGCPDPAACQTKVLVTLPAPLIIQLRAHHKRQLAERLATGPEWQDWDLVFCKPNGAPIDSKDDYQDWQAILTEAGVRDARVHDARHTAATLLLEQGTDIRVVQQILGHSQLRQTQRYTHVTAGLSQDAADRMAKALWG